MANSNSQPQLDLMCVGSVMIDLVGQKADGDLGDVDTFRRSLGGACINVAATATRLGRRVAIASCVGNDPFGRYARAEMRRLGIQDEWLQVDPYIPTTMVFFARRSGFRDFHVVRGADLKLKIDDALRSRILQAAAIHTTTLALSQNPCRLAVIEAIELAHAAGRIVCLDPNFRARNWPNRSELLPLLRRLLPLTTVIKPSLQDAEAIWGPDQTPGDYIEQFHEHGARQVLLTLGREGVIVSDGRSLKRLSAIPLDVAATSGVGDAFTAAAIMALLDGQTLTTAAQLGMLVASYRLRTPDRAAPLPAWPSLLEQVRMSEETLPSLSTTAPRER